MVNKRPKGQINKVTVNLGKLSKVLQKLEKKRSIRVGILGKNGSKKVPDSDLTLADLGAVHEFGAKINVTPKMRGFLHYLGVHLKKETTQIVIPVRSFLRAALLTKEGKKALQVWSEDEKEAFIEYLNKDTVSADVLATTIGVKALERVLEAFETSGFGEWETITEFTQQHRKGNASNPPIDSTRKLKNSITFEVKEL